MAKWYNFWLDGQNLRTMSTDWQYEKLGRSPRTTNCYHLKQSFLGLKRLLQHGLVYISLGEYLSEVMKMIGYDLNVTNQIQSLH